MRSSDLTNRPEVIRHVKGENADSAQSSSRLKIMCLSILFSLVVSFFFSTYYPTRATETQIWCNNSAWAIVSNTSRGLELQVDQIGTNFTSGDTEEFDYYYLPPQCAEQESCNSVAVGGEWLAFPSNSSLVFLRFASPDKRHIEPIGHDCNPTNLFFYQDTLWVTCVNSVDNLSQLTYLPYSISIDMDGLHVEYLHIPYCALQSSSFSQSMFIYHPSCFSHGDSNLYTVAADGYVWHFPVTGGVDLVFTRSESPLENCSSIAYIDFRSEASSFTVHCSGGLAATYDTCSGQWQYHYLHNGGLYFSCSPIIETLFINDSIRITHTNGTTIWHKNHSIGDILHGECNGDVFNAVASNGSLYSFVFSLGMFYMVAQNVCDSAGSCFWPTFDPVASSFVGIDRGNAILFLVSEIAECVFPVKEIHVVNIPESAMILISSPGTSAYTCQCSYPDGSEFSTPTTTIADISTVASSTQVDITFRALISSGCVLLILIVISSIVIIISLCYRYWRSRQSQQDNMLLMMKESDDSYSTPVTCDAQDSSCGVVTGMDNPWNPIVINSRDVIGAQEERRGNSEDSRNRRIQKINTLLDHDRQNANIF